MSLSIRWLAVCAFAIASALNCPSKNASADIVYDNLSQSSAVFLISTATNRNYIGGDFQTSGAGAWRLDDLSGWMIIDGTGPATYTDVSARVRIWDHYNPVATGSVYSILLSDETFDFGTITTTSFRLAQIVSFDYLFNGSSFLIDSAAPMGIDITWMVNGTATTEITSGLIQQPPTVGTTASGFYFDGDNDATHTSADFFPGADVQLKINATSVPEPLSCTLFAIICPWLALRIRRR